MGSLTKGKKVRGSWAAGLPRMHGSERITWDPMGLLDRVQWH